MFGGINAVHVTETQPKCGANLWRRARSSSFSDLMWGRKLGRTGIENEAGTLPRRFRRRSALELRRHPRDVECREHIIVPIATPHVQGYMTVIACIEAILFCIDHRVCIC